MILRDFIMLSLFILYILIFIIKFLRSREIWSLMKDVIKSLAISFIIILTITQIAIYLENHPSTFDFLYYRLW